MRMKKGRQILMAFFSRDDCAIEHESPVAKMISMDCAFDDGFSHNEVELCGDLDVLAIAGN